MIRKRFVRQKIDLIEQDLEKLEDVKDKTLDDLTKDYFLWNGVQHILQKIIGRGIDINFHLIEELTKPKMETPLDYKETFLKLGEIGVLPEDFAEEIAKSAGFRNVLVHDYNKIDERIVYRSIDEAIGEYTRYCDYILKFLERAA